MKLATLTLIILTTAACGTASKSSEITSGTETENTPVQNGEAQTQTPQTEPTSAATLTGATPTPSETPTQVVASPEPSQTPAPTPTPTTLTTVDANDTNPNHLNVDPVTGKLDFRYGVFSLIGGGVAAGNWDGCYLLTGTQPQDYNQVGTYSQRTWGYDPNTMTLLDGSVTYTQEYTSVYKPFQGVTTMTVTLYPDGTGFAHWELPATADHAACYSDVNNLKVIPLTAAQLGG